MPASRNGSEVTGISFGQMKAFLVQRGIQLCLETADELGARQEKADMEHTVAERESRRV